MEVLLQLAVRFFVSIRTPDDLALEALAARVEWAVKIGSIEDSIIIFLIRLEIVLSLTSLKGGVVSRNNSPLPESFLREPVLFRYVSIQRTGQRYSLSNRFSVPLKNTQISAIFVVSLTRKTWTR